MNGEPQLTPEETVREFFARYAHGEPERALALFDANVVHTANAFNPKARHAGTYVGRDAVRERVAELTADWAFERYEPVTVVVAGDEAAAMVRVVCETADGARRVDMLIALFFTLADGRIVAIDELFDSGLTDGTSVAGPASEPSAHPGGPRPPAGPVARTAEETVREFFRIYAHADAEAALALFHDDVVHTSNAFNPGAMFAGTFTGVDALRGRMAALAEFWAFERFAPEMIVAEGDVVATRVHVAGTARPTGRHMDMRIALFFTVQDGRITAMDELFDSGLADGTSREPDRYDDA